MGAHDRRHGWSARADKSMARCRSQNQKSDVRPRPTSEWRQDEPIDLNLLIVFDALLEEGSVTPASAPLWLSQSSVHHALGRLRVLIDDELFVGLPGAYVLRRWLPN